MLKMICFDMDGTIADLYRVPNWLARLRQFDPTPYQVAEPMWNMDELALVLMQLQAKGVQICITTWLSKETTPAYDRKVCRAKIDWLRHYDFPFDHFYGIPYGVPKDEFVRDSLREGETAMLIDDSAEVRSGWGAGEVIDPTVCNIIHRLTALL